MNFRVEYEEDKKEPKLLHVFRGKDQNNAVILFSVIFPEKKYDDLFKKCKKLLDGRKEYIHLVYAEIWKNLIVAWPKDEKFHPNYVKNLDEVVVAFTHSFEERSGLDKYEPKQKTIEEAHAEGVRQPVPLKKKK